MDKSENGNRRVELSPLERDRRYSAIRDQLSREKVDCVITSGNNLFYMTNGLPGEKYGLFAAAEASVTVFLSPRHLIDLSPQLLADSQEWVKDIRSGDSAAPVVERIKELGLDKGSIGVTGSKAGSGGLSHGFFTQLQSSLPTAKIVDVSHVFDNVRTVKSTEEIALIEKAIAVFDAGIDRVCEVARPGMLGAQVVHEGIKAMWDAGGDTESEFSFNFGATPKQNPILGKLCMERQIKAGDMGTLTSHASYGHYSGHNDQEISFGEPKPVHKEMFQTILAIREAVLKTIKAGVTQRDLANAYQKACRDAGYKPSTHAQMHQYGIDVPEFPGSGYAAPDDSNAGRLPGSRGGNFFLKSGMLYSISPTLVGKNGEDTLLAGKTLVVTEDGYRELGNRKIEMLIVD
jgi:Xaa-Pro dipeptidase